MDTSVVIAALAAAGAFGAAVYTWQTSSRANAVTAQALKSDRVALYYGEKLRVAEERLARILHQVDLLTELLDKMDAEALNGDADALRDQLQSLRIAAVSLYPELVELRAHLAIHTPPAATDGGNASDDA